MEVMIHLRLAEMVTLGMISIGLGYSTQNSFFVNMGLGFAEKIPAFSRTLIKFLGFLPLAGMLGFNMST